MTRIKRVWFKVKQTWLLLWRKLTFKVTAVVLATFSLAFSGVYFYVQNSLSTIMTANATEKMRLIAKENADAVEKYLSLFSVFTKSLAQRAGEITQMQPTAAELESLSFSTLESYMEDDRIFGVSIAWEPAAASSAGEAGLSLSIRRSGNDSVTENKNDYAEYSAADFYTSTLRSKKIQITDPYDYSLPDGSSIKLITLSCSFLDANRKRCGAVRLDLPAEPINALASNLGSYLKAYSYTLTSSGTMLSHSALSERVGTVYGSDVSTDQASGTVLTAVKNRQVLQFDGVSAITGKPAYALYLPITPEGAAKAFSSAFVVDASEVMAERDSMMNSLRIMIVVGLAIVCAASLFGIHRMVSPVQKIVKVTENLKKGELNITENVKQKNEFGTIFNAIYGVSSTLNELVSDTTALTHAALSGDLAYRADPEKHQGAYKKILEGINGTLDAVIEPVEEASNVLVELSQGRLDIAMEGDYKGDHATIKHALNDTIGALRSYIGELIEALDGMAEGDFSVSIDSEYLGEFLKLKTSVNTIAESMSSVLSEIRAAADQVSAGTIQVSGGSQAISQGAAEQAASIDELTASIGTIAGQTRENAVGANKASELSMAAKERALKGSEHMAKLQSAMTEINVASENISKIIKVIDDIAFQTNILALNAAVEAVRAGIHGKGFGVVAEEVRNLAARSAKAAKETEALIESSAEKAEAGTRIADKTAEELKSILEVVEASAKLVSDIANASGKQATAIAQVNKGIEQMSQVVQTNSATAEEQAATSEEFSGQAEMLKNQVGAFRLRQ